MQTDGAPINVRSSASTAQQPLGTIANGLVTARLSTAAGQEVRGNRNWYAVRNAGVHGDVSAAYAVCVS